MSKLLTRQLDRDLHPFGLSINDYEILVVLSEAPGHRLRMTDLADATAQSRSRLSHQITRMEGSGLVRRDSCPGDKRGLFAVLTNTGLATIEQVAPHHVDSVRRHFISLLDDSQLSALQARLRRGHRPPPPDPRPRLKGGTGYGEALVTGPTNPGRRPG